MFLQYLFIFILGFIIGVCSCYQIVTGVIQRGVDSGKIRFEILDKKIIKR